MLDDSIVEKLKSGTESKLERRRRTNRKSVKKHRERKAMEHALQVIRAEEEAKNAPTDSNLAEKDRLKYGLKKIDGETLSGLQMRIVRHEMKIAGLVEPFDLEPGVSGEDYPESIQYSIAVQWLGYLNAKIIPGESLIDLKERVLEMWCKRRKHASYNIKTGQFDQATLDDCSCAAEKAERCNGA